MRVAAIGIAFMMMVGVGHAAVVAVFEEPGFPFYIASSDYGPEFCTYCLKASGIACDTVTAAQLADPAVFNARKYRVLVHSYGNSFPLLTADNLRAFHAAGGCILAMGGVPFCHPEALENGKWVDKIDSLGWNFVNHQKIGTGLWGEAKDVDALAHADGDPLGLGWLPLPPAPGGMTQFLMPPLTPDEQAAGRPADDPRLPAEDVVTASVVAMKDGKAVGAPVAILHHNCKDFPGAVDIWAGGSAEYAFTRQEAEQVLVASCAYLLQASGAIGDAERLTLLAAAKKRYVAPVTALPSTSGPFILRAPLPAKRLTVLDATGMEVDEKICALSLQGVVNRKQPRVYLLGEFQDQNWFEVLKGQGYAGDEVETLEALLDKYRSEISGAILTDPAVPDTVNIATMMAGLEHAVVATPELAAKLKLKTVADLRGRWKTGMEAYWWALDELWPKLKPTALASMEPTWVGPRDYLIQQPVFTFWIDCVCDKPMTAEQGMFLERVLAKMPPRTAVYGWWQQGENGGVGEGRGVSVSSQYGKIMVCTVGAYNLSVHAGVPTPAVMTQKHPPAGSLDRKIYIAFLISDGDNFGTNMYSSIEAQWEHRMRGKVPIGWGVCPTQMELTPALMDHWYKTATPMDEFITMDGLGYEYPDSYGAAFPDPGAMLDDFLRESGKYMKRTDQRELWYLAGTTQAARMAKVLAPYGLNGLLGEYGVPAQQRQEMIGDVAAIWADVNPWEKPWDSVKQYVDWIRARKLEGRPAFLMAGLNGFTMGPDQIAEMLRQLGPEYVAVRPDELCELYRRWKTKGVDPNPAPRVALDLTPPPAKVGTRVENGVLIVEEHGVHPSVVGWYTDPNGTQWVRKRVKIDLPAAAKEATIKVLVRGKAGAHVALKVNGKDYSVELKTGKWTWVEVKVPAAELTKGENEIWYTGNPEAKLFTAGDLGTQLERSDYGGPDHWSPLNGELMITIEVR